MEREGREREREINAWPLNRRSVVVLGREERDQTDRDGWVTPTIIRYAYLTIFGNTHSIDNTPTYISQAGGEGVRVRERERGEGAVCELDNKNNRYSWVGWFVFLTTPLIPTYQL